MVVLFLKYAVYTLEIFAFMCEEEATHPRPRREHTSTKAYRVLGQCKPYNEQVTNYNIHKDLSFHSISLYIVVQDLNIWDSPSCKTKHLKLLNVKNSMKLAFLLDLRKVKITREKSYPVYKEKLLKFIINLCDYNNAPFEKKTKRKCSLVFCSQTVSFPTFIQNTTMANICMLMYSKLAQGLVMRIQVPPRLTMNP